MSSTLRVWLRSHSDGDTVYLEPGSCYLVDEGIELVDPRDLTIYGGTFRDDSVSPGTGTHSKGSPVFTVLGGSGVTLEAMHISGANAGGYHARLAFAGGVELEGTARATIRGVTITSTFGDGITLAPLRGGPDHDSGRIVAPSSSVTVQDVTIDGVGRQGITFASVSGASLRDVVVRNPGIDTFDFEADQANEGARDVTIYGCFASGGSLFFANGGAGDGRDTGDVTVERCSMAKPEGGSAVLVERPGHGKFERGPFTFAQDDLWCGASIYVACVELSGADATFSRDVLMFRAGTVHEAVYHLGAGSKAVFDDDQVRGYGRSGKAVGGSSVRVSGGLWIP